MGTRTISLSDDAYARLRAAKQGAESFSDVVLRLTGRGDIMRYAGSLPKDTVRALRQGAKAFRTGPQDIASREVA